MFRELSGAVGVRTAADGSTIGSVLNPPVLSGAFRTVNANAEVSRSGYLFKMFLPGAAGIGVEEDDAASDAIKRHARQRHRRDGPGAATRGRRTTATRATGRFFVNQTGDITGKDDAAETGTGAVLAAQAGSAFRAGTGALTSITGLVAVGHGGPRRPDLEAGQLVLLFDG